MAFVITHFYPGGTKAQYDATVAVVHPKDGLPAGQTFHAAGPADGGWLVVAMWDSKASFDGFVSGSLIPALGSLKGGLQGPPQERSFEVANLLTA